VVHPATIDVAAGAAQDFQVFFKPQKSLAFEGEILECYVQYKRNRSFRLVEEDCFSPPFVMNVIENSVTISF
jgi:hypothetical protein